MTLLSSTKEARDVLRNNPDAQTFRLGCAACGWDVFEDRNHLIARITRHFDWPDASKRESVSVRPV